MSDKDYIKYSDPKLNKETKLWEIKKTDQEGNELDIMVDSDKEALTQRKEDEVKAIIIAQINQNSKKQQKQANKLKIEDKPSRGKKNSNVTIENTSDYLIQKIVEMKLRGEETTTIVAEIMREQDLSRDSVYDMLYKAMSKIRETATKKMEEIVETHVARYEKIFKWLFENGYTRHAVKALRLKEALMGVGQESSISLEVNNLLGEKFIKDKLYNLGQLSADQKKRLLKIASRIKVDQVKK